MIEIRVSGAWFTGAGHVPQRSWRKSPSPEVAGWSVAKLKAAREFSETLDTAALMIVQDGMVIDEWGPTALPLKCHSVRKSLLSALFGPHVEAGTIDLDRTLAEMGIDDSEPSLTSAERQVRIRDLLTARSGVYHPALYETKAMAAARPKRGSHDPDTFWYNNNWDFNASGHLFENLTGRSIFEEFEDRIAGPLGMEDFDRTRHTRYVTGNDSVHPAYPFQLNTRDLARFGLLFLRDGRWSAKQIIPEAWVLESTASYSNVGSSGGYGYMWWVAVDGRHFPGVTLPSRSYSARGYRGQHLVVIPAWNIVVAHRVNTYQSGTTVGKSDFGKLLSLIFEARPKPAQEESKKTDSTSGENAALPQFDIIIRNGEVIDGTGQERFRADVAIRADRVVQIGDLAESTADRVIDATGRLIAPGFIDLHSHAEKGLVADDPARRSAPNLITQGITTVVVNQDGGGPLDLMAQRRTMRQLGTGLNVVQVLGHGTIRRAVMGDDHRRLASETELKAMQQHLLTALRGGAFGMSAGLEYVPGRWSTPREMEALAKTVTGFNGVYIVHERSSGSSPMWFLPSRDPAEQPSMLDNIRELIDIVASTRVTTVATHIKARGTDFWGSSVHMNELLRMARDDGLPIYADQYPYNTSGSDGRIVLIPAWALERSEPRTNAEGKAGAADKTDYASRLKTVLEDEAKSEQLRRDIEYEITRRGGADSIRIVEHQYAKVTGKTLAEFSVSEDVSPIEAAIRLQLEGDRSRRGGTRLRAFSMSEKDVEAFVATPWTATSSDAGITLQEDGPVHPRFYGAFPRKIRRYAIDRGLMTIEEAVRLSTSLPAQILGLSDRGKLCVGHHADLVVFDPQTIRDRADAFNPHQFAEGIGYVFVNGRTAVEKSRWLGTLAGSVILKSREDDPETLTIDRGTRTR